jgi:regulator of replication initiation timing
MTDSLPPIPRDLIPMARPYMEGKKLPDEKYALILRTSRAEAALEALQQENAQLRAENTRLKQPVSESEMEANRWMTDDEDFKKVFNSILATRSQTEGGK